MKKEKNARLSAQRLLIIFAYPCNKVEAYKNRTTRANIEMKNATARKSVLNLLSFFISIKLKIESSNIQREKNMINKDGTKRNITLDSVFFNKRFKKINGRIIKTIRNIADILLLFLMQLLT